MRCAPRLHAIRAILGARPPLVLRNPTSVVLSTVTMSSPPHQDAHASRTLAASGLPRRVRRIVERALALYAEELEPRLVEAVSEFEEELYRLAGHSIGVQGRNDNDPSRNLREVRLNRHDFVPHFMQLLESGLANLRSGQPARVAPTERPVAQSISFRNLSLVETSVMDEGAVLHEIATRQESRANLALHMAGQRFGVLAAGPAFDGERLPLGAQALCRAARHASRIFRLDHEPQLLFYRIFDRRVMSLFPVLAEKLDALLSEEGVLPGLTYVPMRGRSSAAEDDAPEFPARQAPADVDQKLFETVERREQGERREPPVARSAPPSYGERPAQRPPAADQLPYDPQRPHTGWLGQPVPAAPSAFQADEQSAYRDLQKLLSNYRKQTEPPRPAHAPPPPPSGSFRTQEVLQALKQANFEQLAPGPALDIGEVKKALLAQARQQQGRAVALSQADNDTFDLLQLFYGQLQKELRTDAPASALLKRLQLTLLQVALNDSAFFVRPDHPARKMLETVSETAAKWLADDDFDPQLLKPLQEAVTHVVKNYEGDAGIFEESNRKLQAHVDQQVRRAETLEKRHIEAARGKEKLEVAKQRSEKALQEVLGERELPKFTRALLNQSWADVLTLTDLRHGEGSEEWRKQLEATRQIVEICSKRNAAEHPELKAHVETALKHVGYHEDEAEVIAKRLSTSHVEEDADGESRTELTMKLKARARLGEDMRSARKAELAPRTAEEQECYERLRLLPFGTWLEFVTNQQGDAVRRRMSWFSPITGNALFVNQRGQRIGEHSLDSLARMMAKDQLRVVTAQKAGLVDRAWNAAVSALRSITGRRDDADAHEVPSPMSSPTPPAGAAAGEPVPPRPRAVHPPAPSGGGASDGSWLIGDESSPPPGGVRGAGEEGR